MVLLDAIEDSREGLLESDLTGLLAITSGGSGSQIRKFIQLIARARIISLF